MVKFYPCCKCCEFAEIPHSEKLRHYFPCQKCDPKSFEEWKEKPRQEYKAHPRKKQVTGYEFMEFAQISTPENFYRNVKLLKEIMKD